ncbi:hypothetical protein [Streptomyces longisporus]|uniref:UL36 very large tegument protein n=1 Tax=Streptomyces longisporus TaxID=1948 RepID=A0ABN3KSU6_STRLO
MAVDQLPGRVREFVNYLNGLLARLDQGGGWCAVFWQRDPEGMRACLEGREVPPWDVVEALLQDLAAEYGPAAAAQEKERARALHTAALSAHDARPGGRDALGDRLDVMLREQRYAAERQAELGRRLASAATRQEADALRLDLAWARDDHERATARCAELRARMADLESRTADGRAAAIRRARIPEGAVYRIDREFPPDEPPPTDGDETHSQGFPHQRGAYDAGPAAGSRERFEAGASGATQPTDSHDGGPAWARSGPYDHGVAEGQQGGRVEGAASGAGAAGAGSGSYRRGLAEGQPDGPFEAAASGAARSYEPRDRGRAGVGQGSHGSAVGSGSYERGVGQPDGPFEAAASGAARSYEPRDRGPAGVGQGSHGSAVGSGSYERGVGQPDGPFEAAASGAARSYEPRDRGPAGVGQGSHGSAVGSGSYERGVGQPDGPFEAAASGAAPVYDHGPAGSGQGPAGARAGAVDQRSGARGAAQPRGPFEAARPVSYEPQPHATPSSVAQPAPEPPAPKQRKRRRGGARFAGMVEEQAAPVAVPPTAAPVLPAPKATGRVLRGARFAGAAEVAEQPQQPQAEPLDAAGPREVVVTVERLVRLRAEGRSGEAHALLVDAAHWPAARFPLLAAELQRAGLGADWATLLWEAASLPADRLVAAADALVAAGRGDDGEQILRQGVARPAGEIGQSVLALSGEGREREVRALLDAYVRVRTPEEAARSAEPDPGTLVPLLLEAAQGVSEERHWDLVHALRVAGFTA